MISHSAALRGPASRIRQGLQQSTAAGPERLRRSEELWHCDTVSRAQPPRIVLLAPDPTLQQRVQLAVDDADVVVAAALHAREAERMLALERTAMLVVDARRPAEREFIARRAE